MRFTARYGYVGFAVEREEFVAEGLNEAGLSAGLFYFPGYGEYAPYDAARNDANIADLQLVPLVLGSCRTIDEVKELLTRVCVIGIDPRLRPSTGVYGSFRGVRWSSKSSIASPSSMKTNWAC